MTGRLLRRRGGSAPHQSHRQALRQAVGLPDDVWRRARGWALWKSLVTIAALPGPESDGFHGRVLAEVLSDPVAP